MNTEDKNLPLETVPHVVQAELCNLALSCISDGVLLTDHAGKVTYINAAAEVLSGWSSRDIVGKALPRLFVLRNPDDNDSPQSFLEQALAGKLASTADAEKPLQLQRRDGSQLPIELHALPHADARHSRLGLVIVFRDVTEKLRSVEVNQRLAAIIESSDDIIATKDFHGIITSWNKGAERILGYAADEIVGQHVSRLVPPDHLEDIDKIFTQLRSGLRVDHYETKRVTKDGRVIDVSLTVSPIRNVHGEIIGASKVGRDITDKRRSHELHERLAAIVKHSDDIIVSKNLDGTITSWNRGAEKILGYTAEEMIGHKVTKLMPEGHREDFTKILSRISQGEAVEHYETKRRRKDGRVIDVSLTVSPIHDSSGKIIGASKIGRDVTAAKEAERLLKQRESELLTLANTIPQLAWMAHADGHIFWYNQRWYEYTGKTTEEMLGWGWQSVHDPKNLPKVMEQWQASLASGEPFEMEFPLRSANGEYGWFLTRVHPLCDEQGQVVRWFGTNTDLTLQRRQEGALKASEARLRAVVEATPECVKIVRADGTLAYMNPAGLGMVGSEPGVSLEGTSAFGLIAPEHRPLWLANHRRVCAGERLTWEFEMIGLKGVRRWMETHAVPLQLPGEAMAQLAVTRDISERKRTESERDALLKSEQAARAEAERASRLKDEFLATLSHELRTPLNAILGWAQLLESDHHEPEDIPEGIAAIARNARAQTELIEDLLDVSRIVTGNLRLDIQQINPIESIEAAVQSVILAAHAKGVRLEKILTTESGVVLGDPHRIQQMVWNLLMNAIKFTPKGGKVQLSVARINSHVQIMVADTGCGISADFLPLVFERFRQDDSSSTRKHGGLGLGLTIVKQLAELHGGTIKAESPGPGKGAVFTLTLPVSIANSYGLAEATPDASKEGQAFPQVNLSGVRILVIDDEADSCRIARRILEGVKAEVMTAESADAGLEAFKRFRPHVVVSDIGMPGRDGYHFIKSLRSLPEHEGGKTPAAALTAFARSEDRRRILLAGFQMHIVKPVEPAELITVAASLAGRAG